MKNIFALTLLASCSIAFAGDKGANLAARTSAQQTQQSTAVSGSVAQTGASTATTGAATSANQQNITFTAPAATSATVNQNVSGSTTSRQEFGTQTIKNTPSVSGAPLVSSNDTCMGSASGAINGPGFGIGLGRTYKDDNCVMLKNSRELWNMGMKAAAMARMCMDSENKEALEITGFVCPQTERAAATAKTTTAGPELTDPYIRQRLGK